MNVAAADNETIEKLRIRVPDQVSGSQIVLFPAQYCGYGTWVTELNTFPVVSIARVVTSIAIVHGTTYYVQLVHNHWDIDLRLDPSVA